MVVSKYTPSIAYLDPETDDEFENGVDEADTTRDVSNHSDMEEEDLENMDALSSVASSRWMEIRILVVRSHLWKVKRATRICR